MRRFKRVQLRVERVEHLIDYLKTEEQREKARIRWGFLAYLESPLPDDSIKAASRYTTKYLIYRHLGAYPATPNASAHIVAPHAALGLRYRDTPIVACLIAVGAFRQTRRKAKSLSF